MKMFHISDVLSVTTGFMVSSRSIEGVYDILNFLTGDDLYTHQLPRASHECEPWLATQFPKLMRSVPAMRGWLDKLTSDLQDAPEENSLRALVVQAWVEEVRLAYGLPEMLPVYEMGEDMHTHIDPVEELLAMRGDKPIVILTRDDTCG